MVRADARVFIDELGARAASLAVPAVLCPISLARSTQTPAAAGGNGRASKGCSCGRGAPSKHLRCARPACCVAASTALRGPWALRILNRRRCGGRRRAEVGRAIRTMSVVLRTVAFLSSSRRCPPELRGRPNRKPQGGVTPNRLWPIRTRIAPQRSSAKTTSQSARSASACSLAARPMNDERGAEPAGVLFVVCFCLLVCCLCFFFLCVICSIFFLFAPFCHGCCAGILKGAAL